MSENKELRASGVVWKRLKKMLLVSTIFVGGGGVALYVYQPESIMLSADGMVTRDHVTVATPLPDARVKQVLVHPGDHVEAGQSIAIVESSTISRTLADLSIEKAKIAARMAELEGRKKVVNALLPVATKTAEHVKTYVDDLSAAKARVGGLDRSIQESSSTYMTVIERALTLKAEQDSIDTEITGNRQALAEITNTYENLQNLYNGGTLTSPVSGYVGGNVSSVGEVVTNNKVAQIYSGDSYALAYLPDSYMFDVKEGQPVAIKAKGQTVTATIERVLPLTEALPPEFQLPNRARNRGQVVRISFDDPAKFAVDQKISVASCYISGCGTGYVGGFTTMVRAAGNSMIAWANDAIQRVRVSDALTQSIRDKGDR